MIDIRIKTLRDDALAARVQAHLNQQTKPVGALGRLEALALQLAVIQGTAQPLLQAPQLLICAADHGLAAQGVSAYPQEVTLQMVNNMLAGGAAVSVLARQHGIALTVVDCGVRGELAAQPGLLLAKVAPGTADSSQGPAMTPTQCDTALARGAAFAHRLPGNALLLGEMGIGNSSSASLLMARLTGLPLWQCVGRGTGLDDAGLAHKLGVLQRVLLLHRAAVEPLAALAAFGGLEIAVMVGAVVQAARERRVIVVDGFISTAAVAVAAALAPAVLERCIFSHSSAETGHAQWLVELGVRPLLDFAMRLGEGSGAALAWPLIVSAERLLAEMATFSSAGVSLPVPAYRQRGGSLPA